jgi:hypothetical protein
MDNPCFKPSPNMISNRVQTRQGHELALLALTLGYPSIAGLSSCSLYLHISIFILYIYTYISIYLYIYISISIYLDLYLYLYIYISTITYNICISRDINSPSPQVLGLSGVLCTVSVDLSAPVREAPFAVRRSPGRSLAGDFHGSYG